MDDLGFEPGEEEIADRAAEYFPHRYATPEEVAKLRESQLRAAESRKRREAKRPNFTVAIDFDGTIVDNRFPDIGEPVPGALDWLHRFEAHGLRLILWTVRSNTGEPDDPLSQALLFCERHTLKFDFINENPQPWTSSAKAFADIYIDDSAVGCPLIENPDPDGKPYVDWEQVGPKVMEVFKEQVDFYGFLKTGRWRK